MSNIPYARERLYEAICYTDDAYLAGLLREALSNMIRKPSVRRAPSKHRMSPDKAEAIRRTAEQHPEMSFQDIAVHVGVNAGRVSEVLNPPKRGEKHNETSIPNQ